MKEESDESTVSQIRQGNKELYGILIERYEDKLIRYGRRFLSDKDSITDIVQDVFIKAYVNLNSFDTSRSFSSWIYRIAHNEYVNLLKKKKASYFSLFEFDTFFPQFVTGKNPYEEAIKKEDKEKIEKVIGLLSSKYKEPLLLFLYEDKSYEEISEILQIPKATVGVRIMRAKKQIAEFLEKYENH